MRRRSISGLVSIDTVSPVIRSRRHLLAGLVLATTVPLALRARAESATLPTPIPPLPPDETRHFSVTLGDYTDGVRVAEISYRMTHGDNRYRLETSGQASGLIALVYSGQLTQASEGRVGPTGLMPESYREKRGRRAERMIRFDWNSQVMIGNGDPPAEVPLPAGTQDRLSLAYQLGLLVRQDPLRAAAGARFSVPLASMRSVDAVTVSAGGLATLRVNGSGLAAIKFEIRGERHANDRIDVWLSPEQAMLPLRIRFLDDGSKVIDQVQNLARS